MPLGRQNYLTNALRANNVAPADVYEQMAQRTARQILGRKARVEVPTYVDVLADHFRERELERKKMTGGDKSLPELLYKGSPWSDVQGDVFLTNGMRSMTAYRHPSRDELKLGITTRERPLYNGTIYDRIYSASPEEQRERSKMMVGGGGLMDAGASMLGKLFGGLAPTVGKEAARLGKEALSKVVGSSIQKAGDLVANKISSGQKPSASDLSQIVRDSTSDELLRITRGHGGTPGTTPERGLTHAVNAVSSASAPSRGSSRGGRKRLSGAGLRSGGVSLNKLPRLVPMTPSPRLRPLVVKGLI